MQNLRRVLSSITSRLKLVKRFFYNQIEDRHSLILVGMIIGYTVIFSFYSLLKHESFSTYGWDLGIFSQSLWTTLHEHKLLYYTLENPNGQSFFAIHHSPILFLLLPVYAIYPHPETLLVLQSFMLALGALPLYWIAREEIQDRMVGLLISASYLLYPALHGVNRFDFHVQAFLPAFFLFAFYYYRQKCWKKYFLFLTLALSCIEFVPFMVIFFAFYQLLDIVIGKIKSGIEIEPVKEKLLCFLITLLLGVVFLIVATWTLSIFNPSQPPVTRLTRKGVSGDSVREIFLNLFLHPRKTLLAIFRDWPNKFNYLLYLFTPLMFLPLFSPLSLLLVVPWIGAAFITTWSAYYSIYYQYSSFVIPFLFISTVYGLQRLSKPPSKISKEITKKVAVGALLCTLLLTSYLSVLSPLNPFSGNPTNPFTSQWWPKVNEHHYHLNEALSLIPPNSSVLTQNEIIPHLSGRLGIFEYVTDTSPRPEYILLDPSLQSYRSGFLGPFPSAHISAANLIKGGNYGLYALIDGIFIYKRDFQEELRLFKPQKRVFHSNQLITSLGRITWDSTSTYGRVIVSDPTDSVGIVWFGPYKYFVPGSYVATFRLKTSNETCRMLLDVASHEGKDLLNLRTIYGNDFEETNNWQSFSLTFEIDKLTKLEFRGRSLTNNTQIALDYITVTQLDH